MKITVEYDGYPTNEVPKIVVYENLPIGSWVDGDWDFLFESLRAYRDHLKLRAAREDSLGKQIVVQARVDRLEMLFNKYSDFIRMSSEGRYDL